MEPSVQVFYVVEGCVSLSVRGKDYLLRQEDLFLVNAMEPYRLSGLEDAVLCVVCIEYGLISRYYPETGVLFRLNSMDITTGPYEDIREIFRELVFMNITGGYELRYRQMSRLYELLDILLVHCVESFPGKKEDAGGKLSDDEKLQRILAFVNGHYQESFSLRELADSMFVSTSTLSRFFKKQTGYFFADYVNRVRLMHAASQMKETQKSITRIAMDCGFANSSSFSRIFRGIYGMSPLEYRREQTGENEDVQAAEKELLREKLSRHLMEFRPQKTMATQKRQISVDVHQSVPFFRPWRQVINMGSLSSLTQANVQYHLLSLAKDLQVTHVKIWSVFTRDLRITDGKGKGPYNYSVIDTVLDMIVENNLKVYFDFGSRPDVIIGSGDTAILSEEAGIVFADRSAWESLFEDFIRHLVKRYGREEIRDWIFDFCEDPSFRGEGTYYQDSDYNFRNVFSFAWRTLRRLAPGARVGGPVGLPNSPGREIETFLKHCAAEGCMPDFVSFPLLPYEPHAEKGSFSRNPEPFFELRQLQAVDQLIRLICGKELPIYVSDWNLSVSNRNILNDSCMRGAYFCSRAYGIMRYAKLCCIWIASDWISNFFDSRNILSGSGGMVTRDSIRKPAYYAALFLGKLQGQLLYADEHLIVTMKNRQSFLIVCSNQVQFHVNYYLKNEDELTPESMDAVVVSAPACSFELDMQGLDDGAEYIVKIRSVSRNYGSIQDEWKRFEYEEQLGREDIKYLREICVPHLSMTREKVQGGRLRHQILLDEQEFQLIHIFQEA